MVPWVISAQTLYIQGRVEEKMRSCPDGTKKVSALKPAYGSILNLSKPVLPSYYDT